MFLSAPNPPTPASSLRLGRSVIADLDWRNSAGVRDCVLLRLSGIASAYAGHHRKVLAELSAAIGNGLDMMQKDVKSVAVEVAHGLTTGDTGPELRRRALDALTGSPAGCSKRDRTYGVGEGPAVPPGAVLPSRPNSAGLRRSGRSRHRAGPIAGRRSEC